MDFWPGPYSDRSISLVLSLRTSFLRDSTSGVGWFYHRLVAELFPVLRNPVTKDNRSH